MSPEPAHPPAPPPLRRFSPSAVTAAAFATAALIMTWNTFRQPLRQAYDAAAHIASFEKNASLEHWSPRACAKNQAYNPPLYYWFVAKLNSALGLLFRTEIHPVRTARWLQLAGLLAAAGCCSRWLLPRLGYRAPAQRAWFALAFFLLPNQYLLQVMPRADHLLFLAFQALLVLWYGADFPARLASSGWRQAVWIALMAAMGHARASFVAAWFPFGLWGGALLLRHAAAQPRSARRALRLARAALLLALLTWCSFGFYIRRYLKTGEVAPGGHGARHAQYQKLEKKPDLRPLFLNAQFGVMFATPNRHARYAHGNNAFLPRLVNDMWADHWLYFSSAKRMTDNKPAWKRVVLAAAAPFTVLYFVCPLLCAAIGLRRLCRGQPPSLAQLGGWIFCAACALLVVFVRSMPEPGVNASVKFGYLSAYSWLPFFCLAELADRLPRAWPLLRAYTAALFALALPLDVFW